MLIVRATRGTGRALIVAGGCGRGARIVLLTRLAVLLRLLSVALLLVLAGVVIGWRTGGRRTGRRLLITTLRVAALSRGLLLVATLCGVVTARLVVARVIALSGGRTTRVVTLSRGRRLRSTAIALNGSSALGRSAGVTLGTLGSAAVALGRTAGLRSGTAVVALRRGLGRARVTLRRTTAVALRSVVVALRRTAVALLGRRAAAVRLRRLTVLVRRRSVAAAVALRGLLTSGGRRLALIVVPTLLRHGW